MGIAPAFDGTKYGNFLYIRSGCIDRRDFAALVWRCFLYPVPDFPIFPERAPVQTKAVFVPCGKKATVRTKAVLAPCGKAAGETKTARRAASVFGLHIGSGFLLWGVTGSCLY